MHLHTFTATHFHTLTAPVVCKHGDAADVGEGSETTPPVRPKQIPGEDLRPLVQEDLMPVVHGLVPESVKMWIHEV